MAGTEWSILIKELVFVLSFYFIIHKVCSNMPSKHGQSLDVMDVRKLDSPLLLANSPECWSVSVLLASEELQDTEWLMVGLMAAGLSAPEELEA